MELFLFFSQRHEDKRLLRLEGGKAATTDPALKPLLDLGPAVMNALHHN